MHIFCVDETWPLSRSYNDYLDSRKMIYLVPRESPAEPRTHRGLYRRIYNTILQDYMDENNQDPIRRSIDDLLREDRTQGLPAPSVGLPAFLPSEPMDYDELKTSSMVKSKKVMGSLLKFYLSQELIDKNEYIRAKANLEITTLSSLIAQMEMSERAITILMRSIDAGEVSPRMFEVLGGLQKTLLDIMKHQTLHMMAAEENMKKMRRDIDVYQNTIDTTTAKIEQQGTQTSRGTRNLMREIQAELGNEEPEEDPYDFDSEAQNEI